MKNAEKPVPVDRAWLRRLVMKQRLRAVMERRAAARAEDGASASGKTE